MVYIVRAWREVRRHEWACVGHLSTAVVTAVTRARRGMGSVFTSGVAHGNVLVQSLPLSQASRPCFAAEQS